MITPAIVECSVLWGERCINKQLSCYVLSSSTGVSPGDSRCKRRYMTSAWETEGFSGERYLS